MPNWLQKIASVILFHGTSKKFDSFNLDFAGQRDWGDYGFGVYLSKRRSLAEEYAFEAVRKDKGIPVVYKVLANIHNTAYFGDKEFERQVSKDIDAPFPKTLYPGEPQTRPRNESQGISAYLQSLGYDSATNASGWEIVVFDPNKLKIVGESTPEDDVYGQL